VKLGATLADQDLTAVDYLTTESLDAEELWIGVATVSCRGDTLFTCHLFASLLLRAVDRGDLHPRVLGTETLTPAISGLVLVTKDVDLRTLDLIDYLASDFD